MKLSQILVIFAILACVFAQRKTKAVSAACSAACSGVIKSCLDKENTRKVALPKSAFKHTNKWITNPCTSVRDDCYAKCTF